MMAIERLHQEQPVLTFGAKLEEAKAAAILLHGRGATAESLLGLAAALSGQDMAYLLPQAANRTWYPNSGFAPLAVNEPYLSSAMARIGDLIQEVNDAGIPTDKIVLGGFSQGACLAAEFAAQHARRYGGLLVLSGALLGPLDRDRSYEGSLDETPVFIGGVNRDPWVSEAQLRHAAATLESLGGQVSLQVLPGAEHTVRPSEIEQAAAIIRQLV
jgi:phospholipase/carboxylesterase